MRRRAGFIPDKIIRGYEKKLAKLLKAKIRRGPYESDSASDKLTALLKEIESTILASGVYFHGTQDLKNLIKRRIERASGRIADYTRLRNIAASYWQTEFGSVQDYLMYRVSSVVEDAVGKIDTLEKMLTFQVEVDPNKIRALSEALLKKASPEELSALALDMNDRDFSHPRAMEIAGEYYKRVGLITKARKLVTKEKNVIPLNVENIFRYIAKNPYADTKFDIQGLQVIVAEGARRPSQIRDYAPSLKKAYALLQAKGLQRVWYGPLYLECDNCSGQNPYTGDHSGGIYHSRKDYIVLNMPPTGGITEAMIHELGHRWWYKVMTKAQRDKFTDLVKVHARPRPSIQMPTRMDFKKSWDVYEQALKPLEDLLPRIGVEAVSPRELSEALVSSQTIPDRGARPLDISRANVRGYDFEEAMRNAFREGDVSRMHNLYKAYKDALYRDIQNTVDRNNAEVDRLRPDVADEEWHQEYEKDPRKVLPVSSYGASSTEEAFAEVFMKYVMNADITRDQMESFKAVLKLSHTVFVRNAVAVRTARIRMLTSEFLQALRSPRPAFALENLVDRQSLTLGVPVDAKEETRWLIQEAANASAPQDVWDQWVRDIRIGYTHVV